MNREDVGEYFRHGCEIYQAFAYIDQPALELRNIKTGERKTIVINSPISAEYHKLCEDTQVQDDRIQKAIEYIESDNFWHSQVESEKRLLDILKGGIMNKERMEKIKKLLDKENIDYEWEILELNSVELQNKIKELLQIDQIDLMLKYLYQEQRIDKAIEQCKQDVEDIREWEGAYMEMFEEIIEILKGSEDNDK